MEFSIFAQYICPELAVLPFALYALGAIVKHSQFIKDKYIPLLLGACGIALAAAWVLATRAIASWQNLLAALFTAVVQGLLCAAASVYANQTIKQSQKTA